LPVAIEGFPLGPFSIIVFLNLAPHGFSESIGISFLLHLLGSLLPAAVSHNVP
jgi:hypothetical protein